MSGARARRRPAGGSEPAAPALAGAFVALLERRGRFLTAEPLFPRREEPSGPQSRRGGSGRAVVSPPGSRGGGVRASPGDIVLAQRSPRASAVRVIRVIGRPDVARDVIEALMLDRGLSRGFPDGVEREAREAARRAERTDEGRRDLRGLATFTIDPITARDFDDAISAEQLDGGNTRVWVHIADVTAHVPEESSLDREARRRATSVYVPGAVEPMLPLALSSDACSLRAGVDRRAVTVELELNGAEVVRAAFYRSLIRSDECLDYERVDRIFAGRETAAEPWAVPLSAARAVARELERKRERRGALVIDSMEPEVSFDEEGNVSEIRARLQTESHRLIEHLMIAANEAVAALLAKRGVPCLYRVHEPPDPERVVRLADQLASLGVPTPPLPEPMSSTQATELLGEISRLLERHVRRTGHGRQALGSLVLRALKQAYYSPRNLGHAGLRSTSYCHFTSPIRRYPDVVCHRALLSAVGDGERAPQAGSLAELGAWTSEREREAMTIERDADDVASCFALEQLLYQQGHDQPFAGEITGLISAGAFVTFGPRGKDDDTPDAPPYRGMLPVRSLARLAEAASSTAREGKRQGAAEDRGAVARPRAGGSAARRGTATSSGRRAPAARGATGEGDGRREWWELNEQGTMLRGERTGATLRLGDPIEVRVARVEAIRGRVDLTPAG
ncbi:MAG TPA: RNB domain-containing ribonuclease [Solirubrobacteraceae bacterium]|nr:RNB domain-containing ribonuclease [Solirubrobacteraceae bacterium]